MDSTSHACAEVLLRRRGLVFLPVRAAAPASACASNREIEALLLEWAALGYAASSHLRLRLETLTSDAIVELREWTVATLAAARGADQVHTPLFRRFPRGIPKDTHALWVKRVLVHYIQAPNQPCLWCEGQGSTHVLRPCEHVVCERCFDGRNYSACPICNRHVDRSSPFFKPSEVRDPPKEQVRFERLGLGDQLDEGLDQSAKALCLDLCARTQALSPADKADFTVLIDHFAAQMLAWLPETIPVKESVALIFGRLFALRPSAEVLPVAKRYLRTATDVLRFIAAYSGADAALQGATVYEDEERRYVDTPWWDNWAKTVSEGVRRQYETTTYRITTSRKVRRFPVAKLSRSLRRALLELLEGFDEFSLCEDMLRHRSYWVWVGEFLHPGEYRRRYPKVAAAFELVRRKRPDGTRPAPFRGYYSQLEMAADRGDAQAMAELLATRPGELGRRFDHLVRVAMNDETDNHAAVDAAVDLFVAKRQAYSTPVLLTHCALLPTRAQRAKRRVFWPKGAVARGVSMADKRPPLPARVIERARAAVVDELLRRFAALPAFETGLLDAALANIVVPFNERTASPAAVNLPRGSRVAIPDGKRVRLFLHWCEPKGGETTDIDLSVGFYDDAWTYAGVCSYYALSFDKDGKNIARSSGDLTSAPYPDGASEFVDIDRAAARAAGIRYAVMVVNAYAGEPFDRLERGFAGLMLRDDSMGTHFDPRTVALKFALAGTNGVYVPVCVDLKTDTLHWLDIYSKGQPAMNNVDSSNASITTMCPETLDYFASGARLDMLSLARLHAAARCQRVFVRGRYGDLARVERQPGESAGAFLTRLEGADPDAAAPTAAATPTLDLGDAPVLALIHDGDLGLPEDSKVYALFRDQLHPNLAAADLIA